MGKISRRSKRKAEEEKMEELEMSPPSEDEPEEAEEETPPLELSVDEIVAAEGDIPTINKGEEKGHRSWDNRCTVCFECDDIFDSESIHILLQNDFHYYKKYKRYNTVHHFNYNQEPFSYMYEKKCWELKFFDKLCIFLRQRVKPLNSEPFSPSGFCSFFEFETLYSPSGCSAYIFRTHEIMRRNFERFRRAAITYNADFFDTPSFSEIIEDATSVAIPSSMVMGSNEVKIVDREGRSRDEIPEVDADRSQWPSDFMGAGDFPKRVSKR